MLNIEKYKDKIIQSLKNNEDCLCELNDQIIKNECVHCKECKIKTIEWLCQKYVEPVLSDEGIEFLKQQIKRSGMEAIYIKITKKVANYYEYRLEIHLSNGLITIPFAEKSGLYEMFKNVEIGKDYAPKELGL